MPITVACNLDPLIDGLRLRIGDIVPATYKYLDEWLRTSLVASAKTLSKWFNFKYLIDSSNNIYRNPNYTFIFDEATYGIIEPGDEQAIIIMASIIVLGGSLENASWDAASWRDAEISFSNLEQFRTRGGNLARLWDELLSYIKPPMKRLAYPRKGTLPGYKNNPWETADNN